jgi:O-antigen ligase
VPSAFVPWYHNEYLNLAVQVGLPGLILYFGFWVSLILSAIRVLRQFSRAPAAPYVLGSLAALCGLLIGALFDHLLWRPDSGGLVAWMAGILAASMRLATQPIQSDEVEGS